MMISCYCTIPNKYCHLSYETERMSGHLILCVYSHGLTTSDDKDEGCLQFLCHLK